MKLLLALCLVPVMAGAAPGPSPRQDATERDWCGSKLADAPALMGLQLGMTPQQVLALFPGSEADAEVRAQLSKPPSPLGVSSLLVRPERYASKDKYAGLTQITATLLDGRVSTLHVGYKGPAWKHVDEFVSKFVEGKNLPGPGAWEAHVGLDTQLKTLKCEGFELSVFAGGDGGSLNYVQLTDIEAKAKLKERRDKARANAQGGSKP